MDDAEHSATLERVVAGRHQAGEVPHQILDVLADHKRVQIPDRIGLHLFAVSPTQIAAMRRSLPPQLSC
ncbi:MAG: hypothetical protein HYS05_08200 [Acidobacteria bacterium]|nr:hypothetical protein [Acidobacteriota bacterium]